MNSILGAIAFAAEKPGFDENSVTPTWVGFAVTFAIAAVTILLVLDMVRRLRRARYRGEIRERIEAEQRESDGTQRESDATKWE